MSDDGISSQAESSGIAVLGLPSFVIENITFYGHLPSELHGLISPRRRWWQRLMFWRRPKPPEATLKDMKRKRK